MDHSLLLFFMKYSASSLWPTFPSSTSFSKCWFTFCAAAKNNFSGNS